jgi:hypothetical protein
MEGRQMTKFKTLAALAVLATLPTVANAVPSHADPKSDRASVWCMVFNGKMNLGRPCK